MVRIGLMPRKRFYRLAQQCLVLALPSYHQLREKNKYPLLPLRKHVDCYQHLDFTHTLSSGYRSTLFPEGKKKKKSTVFLPQNQTRYQHQDFAYASTSDYWSALHGESTVFPQHNQICYQHPPPNPHLLKAVTTGLPRGHTCLLALLRLVQRPCQCFLCVRVWMYIQLIYEKKPARKKNKKKGKQKKGGRGQGGAACETPFPAGDISTWTWNWVTKKTEFLRCIYHTG